MKILLFSFYYSPDLCAGSFRIAALVNQLKYLPNVDIEVVTTMPNRYSSFQSEACAFEKLENVTVHRIPLPSHKSGMLDQVRAFSSYFRNALRLTNGKKYDLVFGTSSRLFTAFLAAWVANSKNLPLYLDVRDIFVDTIKDVLSPKTARLMKPFLGLIERYTFRKANHINLVSKGFKEYFETRYPKPSYSFFTNGIDDEFLLDGISEISSSHANKKTVKVLYAGNIGEGQGLHAIVPELAKLVGERFQFRIIGDGGRKKALQDMCKDIENIIILPPISRNELVNEYLAADVLFLHLNDYSAFEKVLPSKLFEYGAMGKPILAGVKGYSSEFIQENLVNSRVFRPTDARQGAKALESLEIKDTKRTEFIRKYSRENIMKEMSNSVAEIGHFK